MDKPVPHCTGIAKRDCGQQGACSLGNLRSCLTDYLDSARDGEETNSVLG